jgi:hypothetical protein
VKLDERLEIIDYPPGFNLADHQFLYQNGELGMTARSSFTITVMLDTSMLKVGDSLLLSCWISDDDDLGRRLPT